MSTQERLEAHPELKKYVEAMLDFAEDVTGTLQKADVDKMKIDFPAFDKSNSIGVTGLQSQSMIYIFLRYSYDNYAY